MDIGYPQYKTDKSEVNLRSLYRIMKNNKQSGFARSTQVCFLSIWSPGVNRLSASTIIFHTSQS